MSSLQQVFPSVLGIILSTLCTLAENLGFHGLWGLTVLPVSLASRSVAKAFSQGQPALFLSG